ncbi:MAG: DNA repair protein RadC [Candidatus Bipolaricaulis sp.]|nr:DNA repair protein RadC [Candidatus Bipolaricaulis sp.]MDD5219760.1 DNA repair protein RadC [Candidatus Bipolaricaulis sp.]MDD5645817.1 DNA repair protein RadC [Candidatus Bipolaricaulis sp.]
MHDHGIHVSEPSLTRWDPDEVRRIRQLPRVDRPREKLLSRGAESLSDVELLAVLLGSGTRRFGVLELASRVLRETEGKPSLDVRALRTIDGLGEAKACQVASALELGRRWFRKGRPVVRHASDALPYVQEIRGQKQEHFVCVSLSGANEVIASRVVTVGLLDTNQVHPREVFADPIADRAASVLLAHNHPSGTLAASPEDIALTKRLVQAGQLLGIRVLDHLIVTADGFLSLKQEGYV